MRICAYAHTYPPYTFFFLYITFVLQNPEPKQTAKPPRKNQTSKKTGEFQNIPFVVQKNPEAKNVLHSLKKHPSQLIYRGENM